METRCWMGYGRPAGVTWEAYLGNTRQGKAQGHGRGGRCAPSPATGLPPRLDAIPQAEMSTNNKKGESR